MLLSSGMARRDYWIETRQKIDCKWSNARENVVVRESPHRHSIFGFLSPGFFVVLRTKIAVRRRLVCLPGHNAVAPHAVGVDTTNWRAFASRDHRCGSTFL
jgi:hypothetical protein